MANARGFGEKRFKRDGRCIDDAQRFLEEQGFEVISIIYDDKNDEYVAQVRNLDGV